MAYYEEELGRTLEKRKALRSKLLLFQTVRVLLFLAIFAGFIVLRQSDIVWAWITTVILVAAFAWSVKKWFSVRRMLDLAIKRQQCIEDEIRAATGDWSTFGDGAAYVDIDHAYSHDLDLFGRGSLFQFLNRTATIPGEQCLSSWLNNNVTDTRILTDRQTFVEELGSDASFLLDFQSLGMLENKNQNKHDELLNWSSGKLDFTVSNALAAVAAISCLFSFYILIATAMGAFPVAWFAMLVVLPLILTGIYFSRVTVEYRKLGRQHRELDKIAGLFELFQRRELKCALGKKVQAEIGDGDKAIRELAKIMNAFDARNNFIIAIFFNIYFQWELLCMWRLQKWHRKHAADVASWMSALGEAEACMSFARFRFNHRKQTTFPEFLAEGSMKGEDLAHPFIPSDVCVGNSFSTDPRTIAIITGANMAGKSTFLRTLGINLVLSMAGGAVMAKFFSLRPVPLYSSMRTADSLNSNESYFYNELKRLHVLVNELESGKELFVVLDEILKGTNSVDKARGSAGFIEKLLKLPVTGVIATHDLSLCELEERYPDHVTNLFFDVEIKDDDLHFDYKLKPGVCSNMNATFLMKKMGIVS